MIILQLNSEKGIFKSLQLEFDKQLKNVLAHFHQSDDPKFSLSYLVRKLKELENVHISKSQAHVYLTRLHSMGSPSSRALIKFKSRRTRMEAAKRIVDEIQGRKDDIIKAQTDPTHKIRPCIFDIFLNTWETDEKIVRQTQGSFIECNHAK